MIVVLVSFENEKHAEKAANYLIDNKLAACVEYFPVQSVYVWNGKRENVKEFSGIIKTDSSSFGKVKIALEKILSYDTPQIIKIESDASEKYLKWLKEAVK